MWFDSVGALPLLVVTLLPVHVIAAQAREAISCFASVSRRPGAGTWRSPRCRHSLQQRLLDSATPFTTIRPCKSINVDAVDASLEEEVDDSLELTVSKPPIPPKVAVKLFGRLAENYIMLDASGGMCCYSGCSDCEYRLPGGGYRMADQSSARPKWIPSYDARANTDREHATKWSTTFFADSPMISEIDFIQQIKALEYTPPLGGPRVSASAAQLDTLDDEAAINFLFQMLAAPNKERLSKFRMSQRLKEMAGGEEGVTWKSFAAALNVVS
jgi:hypothetical protein